MTPLAHRIVKELTLPISRRSFLDQCDLLPGMSGAHCFEATEVLELADELDDQLRNIANDERFVFLPAESTWIEWVDGYGTRFGVLLQQCGAEALVRQARLSKCGRVWESSAGSWHLPLCALTTEHERQTVMLAASKAQQVWPFLIYAFLAIINTPRLIGRKQHMPHRGLERRLASAKGMVGKFPLRAWTELKLSVAAMMTEADGTVHEAHYTGEKCLHFCRAHIRVRNGRLEQVKAHWRGNPALGLKRTRYKITP